MNDEEMLARARATWQQARISEAELHQGAQRVARRLRAQRRSSGSRTPWMLAGSVAAFMATLAYAGMGRYVEPSDGRNLVVAPLEAMGTGAHVDAHERHPTATANIDQESRRANERVAPSAEKMRDDRALPIGQADDAAHAPSPSDEVAVAATIAREPTKTERSPAHPAAAAGTGGDGVQATGSGRSAAKAKPAVIGNDTSWRAVSDALAAGKHWRAEHLLTRLAERGGDANTRAKAKLGLGQLEASRGRCAKARQLALAVAGQQGIETKTVRRALELAARCLR